MSLKNPPLSLYIHLPWCIKKCPYCDFNSHSRTNAVPEKRYVQALLNDLDWDLPLIGDRQIDSIFFGGGTPSLFSPDAIHSLIGAIQNKILCSDDMEISLEANPGAVEKSKFKGFREAGVNRLSIGIQSFQASHLLALGRIHSALEAHRAVAEARKAGFDNFNLDLMYGLPSQNTDEGIDDLKQAISLKPSHISHYQLTIEAHTWFSKFPPVLPGDEKIWKIEQESKAILADHGYHQYEISAYSRQGFQCHHNLNYWTFGDYLGIGAGAHGKITDAESDSIYRTFKSRHPEQYMTVAGTAANIGNKSDIPKPERGLEFLMNALRLKSGFKTTDFIERTGLQLSDLDPQLTQCLDQDLLKKSKTHIQCTENGQNFLDEILSRFVSDR